MRPRDPGRAGGAARGHVAADGMTEHVRNDAGTLRRSEPDPEADVSVTPQQPADLVLTGGRIATMDAAPVYEDAALDG